MKFKLFFLLCLYTTIGYSQNCNCDSNKLLKSIINCTPNTFSNGNSLKWNYDCNASYLVFENKEDSKILFELEAPLLELTRRLGYAYWKEFNQYFIIQNKVVSGSQPAEYILFDKDTGNEVKQLGYQLGESKEIIYFLDFSNEDQLAIIAFDKKASGYKTIDLPNEIIENSMRNSNYIWLIQLFKIENIETDEPILMIEIHNEKGDIDYFQQAL